MTLADGRGTVSESGWKLLRTDVVHKNRWFEVRADAVIRPDGGRDVYSHVVAPGSVTVLALDGAGRVVLTRQWIYTHGSVQWRLPGGGVEADDADPFAAARREFAEETGLRASTWEPLGLIHSADSLSNHVDRIYLATGLTGHDQALGPGEADLVVTRLPFEEVLDLVRSGQVPHAGSAHAVLTMALRLSR
ncbi:NUDIX domain-containing protein [Amycolatopsis alba]|uniref:NUDIX domain-containing protein n=1 Tax=Amycolatopsis alba DSM 44262 TaxID=1125972 RepID=A0A229RK69_AMYAL|nr:NUDIX hydrolase [Amycolatopsis alba]OXM47033.1 NUDIX domain-containing protein [Amycolatopsis alba DSM 44262]